MAGYFLYIEEASKGSASDDFEGIEWRKYVKKRLLFIISILFLVTLLIPFRGKAKLTVELNNTMGDWKSIKTIQQLLSKR